MPLSLTGIYDSIATIIEWVISNYIEVLATLTGLIYLVYSVQGKILLWLFGIISSLCFVYVFYQSKIYANMGLYVYYVIISIYGWIHWSRTNNKEEELPVLRLNLKLGLLLLVLSVVFFFVISYFLRNFTDSDIVLLDAFTSAMSIVATWMLARKILEHWLIWLVVDTVYIGMYLSKELYPTVLLFVVYLSLAFLGYIEWKKKWKLQATK